MRIVFMVLPVRRLPDAAVDVLLFFRLVSGAGGFRRRPRDDDGAAPDFLGRRNPQREGVRVLLADLARDAEEEGRAHADLARAHEAAAVKHGVLARDGQTEARAAGLAHPGGVGSPESIEDVGGLLLGQAYPPVGDLDGDGALAADHQDPHGLALGVLEGVDDEVADDSLDPPRLDLGLRVSARLDDDLHPVGFGERLLGLDDGVGDLPQIRLGARQRHRSGVVAGNLEKVGEHDVEVDELVVLQFGAASQN